MLMDYHAMTVGQPRNTPQQRLQFIICSVVIVSITIYTTIMAGIIQPVITTVGVLEGGIYVYKTTKRDYAASLALSEVIGNNIGLKNQYSNTPEYMDSIYIFFFDHPSLLSNHARKQRFACGHIYRANTNDNIIEKKEDDDLNVVDRLLQMNNNPEHKPLTKKDFNEMPANELFIRLPYKQITIPSVKALICQFPYTNGFVSMLMFTYKILPQLHKQALTYMKEHNNNNNKDDDDDNYNIIIISTCSASLSICTHYIPLENTDTFLLGQKLNTFQYAKTLTPDDDDINYNDLIQTFHNILIKPIQRLFFGKTNNENNNDNEEL